MQTNYPFDDKTALKHKHETKEQSPEDLIYQHDIKIQELETRLNSLENIMNKVQNKLGIYWNEKI